MELQFQVTRQNIKRTDGCSAVADSVNYLTAEFNFESSDWDNTTKTATFRSGVSVYTVILDASGKCVVPWELIRAGKLKVSVYGDGANEYRITADTVDIPIYASGFSEGEESQHPTPSQYEQLTGALSEKLEEGNLKTINGQSIVGSGDIAIEGTEVVANPEGTATDSLTKIQIGEEILNIPSGGTNVEANPSGTPTASLEKIEIAGVIYNGLKGDKGDKGDNGDDYVLTSADKAEIAQIVEGEIPAVEANPSGTASTDLTKLQIGNDIYAIPSGGGSAWIDERDITTKRLKVTDDMELTNISSEETLYLYENDNLCALPDVAETTANGITYKVKDGLIYLNGTASKTFYIPVEILAPKFLLNQTMNFFIEPVSGERTTANIYVWTPFKYLSGSEEKQQKPSTGNAQFTYSKVIGFTTDTKIQVGSGAVCTNLVLRPYFGLRTSNVTPSGTTDLPTGIKHVVGNAVSNTNGTIYGIDHAFSAHVKSKTELPKLFGKKMVACGDSIAYGHSGDPYVYTIADKQNMSYDKEAVGEARLSTTSPTRSITLQVTELTDDYDYILVEGGINDALNDSTIGELTSGFDAELDATTVIGAVETICKFLVEHYASAKKLFILCHRTTNANYQPHASQTTYFEAIITALKKWNIPYIDLREYPLCGYNAYYAQTYFSQSDFSQHGGLHPNTAGYALGYIDQITAKMESI